MMRDTTREVGRGQYMEDLGAVSRRRHLFLNVKEDCLGYFF